MLILFSVPLESSKHADGMSGRDVQWLQVTNDLVADMEVDVDTSKSSKQSKSGRGRIERKRSSRKAAIVFPKYKKGGRVSKSKSSKSKK